MKLRNLVLGLCLLAAGFGVAQGPMYDKIIVTLPYPVHVNDTVLAPGEYEIRQHQSTAGGSRIVHFYTEQGMKFETTAMGIAALDNKTPEETSLILEHLDSDYYLNKIWVQGKNYGYEFPLPESVRLREKERSASATIKGRYEAAPEPAVSVSQTTIKETTETKTETEIAQATPPPIVEVQPAPSPLAEVQTPVETQVQPEPAPAPAVTAPVTSEFADRSSEPAMPATAGNWLSLLLGGGLVTGAGMALRRFRM